MSLGQIYESLQKVNEEIKVIGKTEKGYNYPFRGIDLALNLVGPLFKKNNIIISREIVDVKLGCYTTQKGKNMNTCCVTFNYKFTSTIDGTFFETQGIGVGIDLFISCNTK